MHRYTRLVAMKIAIAVAIVAASIGWSDVAFAQKRGTAAPKVQPLAKTKAKTWEVLAFDAVKIPEVWALAPFLWSYRATCENLDNDMARRQCLGVRAMRRQQVAGKTFLMRGDNRSFLASKYDPQKKGSQLKVYSCMACSRPIPAQGKSLYVVGQGESTIFGTQILGPVVHTRVKPFKNAAEASAWKADVSKRLRTEYVVKIVDEEPFWSRGGVDGLTVEVSGFRVYDPCTGKIVAAIPKAKNLPKDESACTGEDLLALQRARDAANAPKVVEGSNLPPKLKPQDIQKGLEPAVKAAQECFAIYGVAGEAKFRLKINGAGKVTEIEQTGYFQDTPTGDCMEDAIKVAQFPQTQKPVTTVTYPFVLR